MSFDSLFWVVFPGYLLSVIWSLWIFSKKRQKLFVAILLWATLVSFLTTMPSLISYKFTGIQLFLRLHPETVLRGAFLNLLFITFWQIGFMVAYSHLKPERHIGPIRFPATVFVLIFLVAAIGYAARYWLGVEYGYTQELYRNDRASAGLLGVYGGFAKLFEPLAVTYLIAQTNAKSDSFRFFGTFKIRISYLCWGSLIAAIVLGLLVDMQRGDIVMPFVFILLVLIYRGHAKKAAILTVPAIVFLMAVSPILDYMRNKNLGDKDLSRVSEALSKTQAHEKLLPFDSGFFYELSRKSGVSASTGSIAEATDENGHVGLLPYLTTMVAPIPRFIWGEKPIAKSFDGTKDGQAMSVAARQAGFYNVWWMSGAGTLYWEFGHLGIIIGALGLGAFWVTILTLSFKNNSYLLLLFFFFSQNWGLNLIQGASDHLVNILDFVKIFGPIYAVYLLFPKKKTNMLSSHVKE